MGQTNYILMAPDPAYGVSYEDYRNAVLPYLYENGMPITIKIKPEDNHSRNIALLFEGIHVLEYPEYPKRDGQGSNRIRLDRMLKDTDTAIIVVPKVADKVESSYIESKLENTIVHEI